MDDFVDLEEIPYDSRDFHMPDLGLCHIRVKPHDSNKENPLHTLSKMIKKYVLLESFTRIYRTIF